MKERLESVITKEGMETAKPETMTDKIGGLKNDGAKSVAGSRAPSVTRSGGEHSSLSVRSVRAIEKVKLTGLTAKKEALKRHEIEAKEAEQKMMKELLAVDAEIEECEAKDKVMSQYRNPMLGDNAKSNISQTEYVAFLDRPVYRTSNVSNFYPGL